MNISSCPFMFFGIPTFSSPVSFGVHPTEYFSGTASVVGFPDDTYFVSSRLFSQHVSWYLHCIICCCTAPT